MNKIIFVIIGIFVSCIICTGANAPRIDTIYLDNQDLSARTKPVMDLNDNPTALLKVSIPRYPDATIVGNMVIEVKPLENAIYWVYVAAGAKKIEVQHVDWGAFEVPLRNIEAKNTYLVKLSVPEPVKLQTADVKFIVTPRDAKIRIDGSIKNPTTDGYITLDVGKHQVRISADGYSDSCEKNWIVTERTTEYKCDLDRLAAPAIYQSSTYDQNFSCVQTTMSNRQSGYSTSRSTVTASQSRAGGNTLRSMSSESRSSAAQHPKPVVDDCTDKSLHPGWESETVAVVVEGHSFSQLARKYYNNTFCWVYLWLANITLAPDPHLMLPKCKLKVPKLNDCQIKITEQEAKDILYR